jgi:hypothetical protein
MTTHAFETGELVKESSSPELYLVGADGKRHRIDSIGDAGTLLRPRIINHEDLAKLSNGKSWSITEALEILLQATANGDTEAAKAYSIAQLYAEQQAHWYEEQRHKNARRGMYTWTGVILFGTLAGVVPVVAQMSNRVEPAWATLALVASGFLFGLDRLYGFTASWQRFAEARLRIDGLRFAFALEWAGAASKGSRGEPLIRRARTLVEKVADIELRETREWQRDLSAQLEKLEAETQSMKTTVESLKSTAETMDKAASALHRKQFEDQAQPASDSSLRNQPA